MMCAEDFKSLQSEYRRKRAGVIFSTNEIICGPHTAWPDLDDKYYLQFDDGRTISRLVIVEISREEFEFLGSSSKMLKQNFRELIISAVTESRAHIARDGVAYDYTPPGPFKKDWV